MTFDELMSEMDNPWYWPKETETPKEEKPYCYCDWKKYIGFSEEYEYCVKCDRKRPIKHP